MSDKKEVVVKSGGGLGFLSVLTLIFITLKLCGVITWSWLWVLAPTWIPLCIMLIIFTGIMLFAGLLFCLACVAAMFEGNTKSKIKFTRKY